MSASQLLFRSRDALTRIGAGRTEEEGKAGGRDGGAADPSDGRTDADGRRGSTVGRTGSLALSIGSEGAEGAGDLEVCSKDRPRRSPSNLNLVFF